MNVKPFMVLTAFAAISITTVSANNVLHGCYTVTGGTASSNAIPLDPFNSPDDLTDSLEQIGEYSINLVNSRLPRNPTLATQIRGPFRGEIVGLNQYGGPLLNHVMGSSDQAGMIFTEHDFAIPTGLPDENGQMPILETLNPVKGTGRFSYLDPANSYIEATGVVNFLTGKNQFNVVGGSLCFF